MNNSNSKTFLLILLGMLTAFGPFVTDMYLPALPAMAGYFSTSSSMVQMGLTTSMIGLAVGQLFFGPLSDKYGRRRPLIAAMWLFIVSTLLCIFARDIHQFVALRFIQGVAGSGGIVISRSVATDNFSGSDLGRMLALIGAINGVAPVAAPIIGGTLCDRIGWQGIFCILLAIGALLLTGSYRFRESLPAARRNNISWGDLLHHFGSVLRNRQYAAYMLQFAFAQGVLFAYIASSPFIVQEHFEFSAFEFSLCFALNAVAIGCAAAFAVRFRRPEQGTRTGCLGMIGFAVAEAAAKKKLDLSKVEYFTYDEGLCVQCMHLGNYDTEPATLNAMEQFAAERHYKSDCTSARLHHEIYLSDPRRTAPEKCKTVIREPVCKVE